MKLLNFIFIKISLLFATGILAGFYLSLSVNISFSIFLAIFALFISAFFRARKQLFQDILFGIVTYLLVFMLGIYTVSLHLPQNEKDHYIHKVTSTKEHSAVMKVRVTEKLKSNLYNERYIISTESLFSPNSEISGNGENISGKILLNIAQDTLTTNYQIGDELLVPANIVNINKPLNPHQFNYKKYMQNLGVLKQLQIQSGEIYDLQTSKTTPQRIAAILRDKVTAELNNYSFSEEELSIIQALLLGQRQGISAETYQNYAAAGAIHILAVSGLHVGIILLILNQLLQPLNYLKYGKFFKSVLLLLLLWSFAIMAGLSASVVRAVSMFSFVAVGMQLQRKTSVMNTLFLSLFFLLLINPAFIFQVGFQLSYLAVFSIVSIQPTLYRLYIPKYKIPKYLWGIFTVTLAAQIGVLPLSLFYFHQFPALFFISNLVILPFLGLVLGFGLLVIFLALLKLLPNIIADNYALCIRFMNEFIAWIAKQEAFLFQEVFFSMHRLISAYLVILAFIFVLQRKVFGNVIFFLTGIIIFQAVIIFENLQQNQSEDIVFHKSRKTILGKKKRNQLLLYHNLDTSALAETAIQNYKTGKNINEIKSEALRNVYKFSERNLLIIDSSGIYQIMGFKPQIVMLINSPKINLDRLIKELEPKQIIVDGSNYNSYALRWKETCEANEIPFHQTGSKGAFTLRGD